MPTIRPLPVKSFQIDATTASIPATFFIQGTYDEEEVREMVLSQAPVRYRGLIRKSMSAEHLGGGCWTVDVEYAPIDPQQALGAEQGQGSESGQTQTQPTAPSPTENLGPAFSFDTTGQTVHITQSRETRFRRSAADRFADGAAMVVDATDPNRVTPGVANDYGTVPPTVAAWTVGAADVGKLVQVTGGAGWTKGLYAITAQGGGKWTLDKSPANAGAGAGAWRLLTGAASVGAGPDNKKAIGITKDGIAGCDIYAPTLSWQLDVKRANCTALYLLTVFAQTGRVNYAAPFWNWPVGSVLYLGATGKFTESERWSLTHKFSCNPGEVNIDIGNNVVVPEKKGWDHMWVGYDPAIAGNGVLSLPTAAYIEIVYPTGDFAALEIG